VGNERGANIVPIWKDDKEYPAPDIWSQLLVEVVLQFERAPAFLRIVRVERRLRIGVLERLDNPRRIGNRFVA